jgi:hypothetical protein
MYGAVQVFVSVPAARHLHVWVFVDHFSPWLIMQQGYVCFQCSMGLN